MTANEKAKDLLKIFAIGGWPETHAIHCIDEIIKELKDIVVNYDISLEDDLAFWDGVKKEVKLIRGNTGYITKKSSTINT